MFLSLVLGALAIKPALLLFGLYTLGLVCIKGCPTIYWFGATGVGGMIGIIVTSVTIPALVFLRYRSQFVAPWWKKIAVVCLTAAIIPTILMSEFEISRWWENFNLTRQYANSITIISCQDSLSTIAEQKPEITIKCVLGGKLDGYYHLDGSIKLRTNKDNDISIYGEGAFLEAVLIDNKKIFFGGRNFISFSTSNRHEIKFIIREAEERSLVDLRELSLVVEETPGKKIKAAQFDYVTKKYDFFK